MKLNVITLSDIVTLTSDKILPNILAGKSMCRSNLVWPKQRIPEGWWLQWATFVQIDSALFNYLYIN